MREISAFYDWAETNQVSPSGILLWHALMHTANKARWPERLAVPISVLEVRTGLKRRTIINARSQLKQLGAIEFESRAGNQSAVYMLNSLCVQNMHTNLPAMVPTNLPTNVPTKLPTTLPYNTSYPTDTRKTKTKTKTNTNTSPLDTLFNEFWIAYPKKVAKQEALKSWRKLEPDDALCAEIIAGVRGWCDTEGWQKDDGQFIPYPATFLNKGRWREVPPKGGINLGEKHDAAPNGLWGNLGTQL